MVRFNDIDPEAGIGRFDSFHSVISSILNKGKPSICGINRTGRLVVLVFNGMVLVLYAVAFARILQLTRVVF